MSAVLSKDRVYLINVILLLSLFGIGVNTLTSLTEAKNTSNKLGYVYWRNATKRTVGSILPRPKQITYLSGHDYLSIDPDNFHMVLDNIPELRKCISVTLGLNRYAEQALFFDDTKPEAKDEQVYKSHELGSLTRIEIGPPEGGQFRCDIMPYADMDETYNLTVTGSNGNPTIKSGTGFDGQARLEAYTNWGLLRGLESVSQLIYQVDRRTNKYAMRPVIIIDEPRFKHRGFMLDTSRHYISLENIYMLLDAMAYNKLNVFHWHLVDDQSFPLVLKLYPQVTRNSSYRPSYIYTRRDVQMVILYAALRGIRVMPELDSPGHSYPLRHIPNVLSECYDPKTKEKNYDFGPVDPTKENAFVVMDRLLGEFNSLFMESYFHAGGDEVDFDCWKSSPEVNSWMKQHNMSGRYDELSNYYIRRLHKMITKDHKKTMLVWQEVFDMGANLPLNQTIVHVWKYINDPPAFLNELSQVVKSGYQALLSSCWYLNYIDYGQDWIKYYKCDPRALPVPQDRAHQVLGGEICMWTEFVDDTNVQSRTWPRASAAAERLWSPMDANNVDEFLPRLEQHRCRLLARGLNAEPVNGPGYC